MKKLNLIFTLMLLTSCGTSEVLEEGASGAASLGEIMTTEASSNFSNSQKTSLLEACDALAAKRQTFAIAYLNKTRIFNYDVETKGCLQDRAFQAESRAGLVLIGSASAMTFDRERGPNEVFTDFETEQNGLLENWCAQVQDKTNCAEVDAESCVISDTQNLGSSLKRIGLLSPGQGGCPRVENTFCFQVAAAFSIDNDNFEVRQIEKASIFTGTSEITGLVIFRSLTSDLECTEGGSSYQANTFHSIGNDQGF